MRDTAKLAWMLSYRSASGTGHHTLGAKRLRQTSLIVVPRDTAMGFFRLVQKCGAIHPRFQTTDLVPILSSPETCDRILAQLLLHLLTNLTPDKKANLLSSVPQSLKSIQEITGSRFQILTLGFSPLSQRKVMKKCPKSAVTWLRCFL